MQRAPDFAMLLALVVAPHLAAADAGQSDVPAAAATHDPPTAPYPGDRPGAPRTDAPPDPASPVEPGTLAAGQLGLRAGVGNGNGPFGVGVEVALGLGGVDLLASIGYLPEYCVGIGTFGSGCEPALITPGFGVQAKVADLGPVGVGVRTYAHRAIEGHPFEMGVASIAASGGRSYVRSSLGMMAVYWREDRNPFGENGFYVGPEASFQFLRGHGGFAITAGLGIPVDGQRELMPLVSGTGVLR